MSQLCPTGSKYTDDQRLNAATEYAIKGSFVKVSESTGIPDSTLRGWRDSEWWDETVAMVRDQKHSEIRARYVEIIQAAQDQTIKELPNATAQQAATVAGIAFDKVRIADNLPIKLTGDVSVEALAQQFQDMYDKRMAERDYRVVSEQKGPIDDQGQGQIESDE
jgi:hypothetical protein